MDPDNRRPVDYVQRRKLLAELQGMQPEQIMSRMEDGLPKLHLLHESLKLRRAHREWFGPEATYVSAAATGPKAGHVVAFQRGQSVMSIGTLYPLTLGGDWGTTTLALPSGSWRNCLTGETVEGGERKLADLLEKFPVALLVAVDGSGSISGETVANA